MRQLERELGKLLRKTATADRLRRDREAPVEIDADLMHDALGRQRFFQESVERTAVPGVSTGLAVTGTGGDVLFIEATAMGSEHGLVLTGQLGDVMKESARIALSYVRSHAEELGIDEDALPPGVPPARAGGRDPQGRPQRRNRDDDGDRLAAERAAGSPHGRDDRRDDAAGPGAADRRPQAEGARRRTPPG